MSRPFWTLSLRVAGFAIWFSGTSWLSWATDRPVTWATLLVAGVSLAVSVFGFGTMMAARDITTPTPPVKTGEG